MTGHEKPRREAPAAAIVTGGAGFIGSHLVDALAARGDHVLVIDDLSSGARANIASGSDRVTFARADVTELREHMASLGHVSTVFHLAALISSHDSLKEPRRYVETNIGGVLSVIDVVREFSIPRVVFASSSTVYGARARGTCAESDVPEPLSVYAASKLAGEHLFAMYAARDGFSTCALRLFNVYGPRQSPTHAYANVVSRFVHAAVRNEPIVVYGDGHQARDFVHVDDVVRAFLCAADQHVAGPINVGTGHACTILELIERIERLTGQRLTRNAAAPWPNDIQSIRADIALLKERLRLEPSTAFDDGIRRTLEAARGAPR